MSKTSDFMSAHGEPILRRAALADAAAITRCTRAAYRKYVPRLGREPKPMVADYGRMIAEHQVWIAEAGGLCLGTLTLVPDRDHMLIFSVAVDPGHQGRGLGRQFMGLAEEEARRQGFGEIRLYTNERMTENIAFYARLDYGEDGRRPHEEHRDSVLVFMSKSLRPVE